MDKLNLINKIKSLAGLTNNEKADLIHLLNETKQYGLVWEDKPEDVEHELLTKLPVLREVTERRILAKDLQVDKSSNKSIGSIRQNLFSGKEDFDEEDLSNTPNHILIEGDNLYALTALTFTHEDKIDVIYIDPPYNTGNKDFMYNDNYVDKEDSYRHSKWLSFMHKRLLIAHKLLNKEGVIFISIDDNEQAQLKLLCDEVFSEKNFISIISWQRAYSPKNQSKKISKDVEYILCYAKNSELTDFALLPRTEKMNKRYKNIDNDYRGPWKAGDLVANEERKNGHYFITGPKGDLFDAPPGKHWSYAEDKMKELLRDNRLYFGKDGRSIPSLKQFLHEVQQGRKVSTLFLHEEAGHTDEAKKELKNFFEQSDDLFSTPKPTRLIKLLLSLSISKSPIILDFFAGSGTTLQATMQLNYNDKKKRQCILVTNNENNIAEEVCYERNKRAILGYTNTNGKQEKGLICNNLRYYKTDLLSQDKTIKNKRQLTLLATEMLCIKENIYCELKDYLGFSFNSGTVRCFTENEKYLFVVYDEQYIEQLISIINQIVTPHKIKIYVFSPGQYPFTEEFEDVINKVEVCALPNAVYKAYMNVLPKNSERRFSQVADTERADSERLINVDSDLFTENTSK